MGEPLVIGVDAGGTATRAVVATLDGDILGCGRAGPGNPIGGEPAAAEIRAALAAALAGCDPAAVVGGVVGLAGHGLLNDDSVRAPYAGAWRSLRLGCPMWTVGDATVAFAAGTPSPSGTVLIAGTGAVAARISAAQEVRVSDGLGWLLGDAGSGFWIGLAAVKAAARLLQAGGGPDELTIMALAHLDLPASADADALVARAYAVPRSALAALAPAVVRLAAAGQPSASRITRLAAAHLLRTLAAVDPGDDPIVLSGGVLAAGSPVTDRLVRAISRRWGAPPLVAGPADRAAAWLAACRITDRAPTNHPRFVKGGPPY
jgi:N-acetylglucosamine kinase-like BadF-type ATPase